MSEQTANPEVTEADKAEAAKLEKITKPAKQAKASLPANVIETKEPNGTIILNAVAL